LFYGKWLILAITSGTEMFIELSIYDVNSSGHLISVDSGGLVL